MGVFDLIVVGFGYVLASLWYVTVDAVSTIGNFLAKVLSKAHSLLIHRTTRAKDINV